MIYNQENILNELIKRKIIINDGTNYIINPIVDSHTFPISLAFSDVAIVQKKNRCKSRLDTNIESEIIRGIYRPIPLIAANMESVCNADFCIKLYELGALGIMHRAGTDDYIISEVSKISQKCSLVAASIGVGKDQFELCKRLVDVGANIITIDIAHGYCDEVINLGKRIRQEFKDIHIIVGNTTNIDMLYEVADWADCLKIGLANGFGCKTKNTAGCNEKQFTSIYKFKYESKKLGLPIISDGSIKEPADFVKAIAAGANSSMAGSIFARCPESAGEVIELNGEYKKIYSGMASRKVQEKWRGDLKSGTCPEGKTLYLDIGESVDKLLERYSGALRSGITYAGATNVKELQDSVEFVRV
jgi:IMP dehydrogenase